LLFSPSGKKVLIESYGEGHQFISVYSVDELVDKYDMQGAWIEPIGILDPYPSSFWNIRWVDDGRIRFSSISDFHEFDSDTRRGKPCPDEDDDVERTWRWCIDTDTFEEVPNW
jgi:hypothetical protein